MKTDREFKKLSSFWIGPLLAGSCLATGYEITHRVMIRNSKLHEPSSELFPAQNPLPGKGIEDLKRIHASSRKTKLVQQKQNLLSTSTPLKAKRMQVMLNALEKSVIGVESPNQINPQSYSTQLQDSEFRDQRASRIFNKQTFVELFKTLPDP